MARHSAVATLVVLAGLAAAVLAPGPRVVARDTEGREAAVLPLRPDGRFELEYVHSYYRAPARESFVALDDGSFRLHSIGSRSEAVLDYYEVAGTKRSRGRWLELGLTAPPRYRKLPLIATSTGRRTLRAAGRKVPLFGPGAPRHLTISVDAGSRLALPRERLRAMLGS